MAKKKSTFGWINEFFCQRLKKMIRKFALFTRIGNCFHLDSRLPRFKTKFTPLTTVMIMATTTMMMATTTKMINWPIILLWPLSIQFFVTVINGNALTYIYRELYLCVRCVRTPCENVNFLVYEILAQFDERFFAHKNRAYCYET